MDYVDEGKDCRYKVKDEWLHFWEYNISMRQYLTEDELKHAIRNSEEDSEFLMDMIEPYQHDPDGPFLIMEGHAEYKEVDVLVVEPDRYPYVKKINGLELDDVYDVIRHNEQYEGYMARIQLEHGVYALINDEGKINGMPPNRSLRDSNGKMLDIIYGSFIIQNCGTFGGTTDLSDEQIQKYTERFRMCECFVLDQNRNVVSMPMPAADDPEYEQFMAEADSMIENAGPSL